MDLAATHVLHDLLGTVKIGKMNKGVEQGEGGGRGWGRGGRGRICDKGAKKAGRGGGPAPGQGGSGSHADSVQLHVQGASIAGAGQCPFPGQPAAA